jgi:hypothetical protein
MRGRPETFLGVETGSDRSGGLNNALGISFISDALPQWKKLKWCAREDLNLHPLRDQILSLARLPFRHSRDAD